MHSHRHQVRRHLLRATSLLVAAALVVACGGDDDSAEDNDVADTDAPADSDASDDSGTTDDNGTTDNGTTDSGDYQPSGTIEVWMHATPGNVAILELFDQYQELYPDATIEVLEIPFVDFETNSLRSTSAGDGPDLIKLSGWVLPDWADKGLLVPMEPELAGFADQAAMNAAYEPGVLDATSYDGVIYALPVDYQNLMLFYNRTHFEEAGLDPDDPPSTWEEVVEVGEQLTRRNGDDVESAGYSWWYTSEIWTYLEMETLAAQLGGSVMNEDATAGALNSEAGRGAVEFYLGLSNDERIASYELIDTGVLDLFADGRASMMVSGTFNDASLGGRTEGALTLEAGTLGVAPMPTFENGVSDATAAYSWGWGVTNNAEDPRLAAHLAEWLNQPAQADYLFSEIGISTPYAGFGESDAARVNRANELLVEQIDRAVYGPRIPQFTAMMTELTQQLQAGASGQATVDDVVENFDSAIQRALG